MAFDCCSTEPHINFIPNTAPTITVATTPKVRSTLYVISLIESKSVGLIAAPWFFLSFIKFYTAPITSPKDDSALEVGIHMVWIIVAIIIIFIIVVISLLVIFLTHFYYFIYLMLVLYLFYIVC